MNFTIVCPAWEGVNFIKPMIGTATASIYNSFYRSAGTSGAGANLIDPPAFGAAIALKVLDSA